MFYGIYKIISDIPIAQVHNPEQHLVNDNGLHHGLARR
jgi:hypothetical protein